MSCHLEFEQWVPFPLPQVFSFFSNPENLPRIMPTDSRTQIVALNRVPAADAPNSARAAGVGTIIVTSFRMLPFLSLRRQWIARITEFEWNRYFADVQEAGPFKTWHHRHEFSSAIREGVAGTAIRDVIDYDIGWGIVGLLADAFFVRAQMRRTFEERQKRLPDLLL